MHRIAFIGGGSFGSALSILLAKKNNDVIIYDRDTAVVDEINNKHHNSRYLENDLPMPETIKATTSFEEAVAGAEYVVLAVPSHVIRSVCKSIKPFINEKVPVISIAKGIEEGTDLRLSVVIEQELNNPVVILSGPSHAEEVSREVPTTVVSTSKDMDIAAKIQDLFMTSYFRVYTNDDIIGVEIGGAVKNIIALAAGIGDGLGYGDNSKAALMTRGMKEISRIGKALGGKQETFYGLAGMGDLIVTCTSMHSRNRRAGILIGQGKSLEEAKKEIGMVIEGATACKAFHEYKEKLNICMPITDALYSILFEEKTPKGAAYELMIRSKKSEFI